MAFVLKAEDIFGEGSSRVEITRTNGSLNLAVAMLPIFVHCCIPSLLICRFSFALMRKQAFDIVRSSRCQFRMKKQRRKNKRANRS